ncbi:hypothetical protein Y032_0145g2469 [Ancylostoma ceylanicum]|uniref:Uncharacterized protein n=1 Tax=Ancylostoma ceylanicum TaxID=53326 RepID=A0A016T2P4_9BILA|nr:hypothetical protein Y032_0145g2469 [Ancylostoma ceylanicum]
MTRGAAGDGAMMTHATSTTPIPGDLRAMKRYNISDGRRRGRAAASATNVELPLLLWTSLRFIGFPQVFSGSSGVLLSAAVI